MTKSQLILGIIISLSIFYTIIENAHVSTYIYMIIIASNLIFSICRKNINAYHICILLLTINTLGYLLFGLGAIEPLLMEGNKVANGLIFYGLQLALNILMFFAFIFRVQISRLFSNSKEIYLNDFDGLFHWVFLYFSLISALALIEFILRLVFNLNFLKILYDNYENLVYVGWSVTTGLLFTMQLVFNKMKKQHSHR
ncbi:hypothetical protein PCIT_b0430 [Pseudoalteromonas citrea]|uniref:Uncharacterized protein n=2 Tax=Pseudoalteromonas citrea TaxID=43655 RepID=A0AAD4FPT5_9GAMM|nr:hypothetical protein PCIT_b0430 [Pseudoalteromonas citrea]